MANHAICAASRAISDGRGATATRTLALFGCCLLMAGCATVMPGTLSDFSEMKAEVSVPMWRYFRFHAPYRKILESSGPVAQRHCASVGRKPVFVSMRGADLHGAVVVGVMVTNTGDAIVLYRCEKQRDEEEEAVRLALAALSPHMVVQVWDKLSATERRRLKDDEPFRRALDEGSLWTVATEMDRVLGDRGPLPQASTAAVR